MQSRAPNRIQYMIQLANQGNFIDYSNYGTNTVAEAFVNSLPSEENSSSSSMTETQSTGYKEQAFVNSLYTTSRDYSMTSVVFQNFCETQNTANSHDFHNIENIINTLKTSQITSNVCQSIITNIMKKQSFVTK